MANHTATHLLHEALRDVLGEHVHQAGSQVRPDKLRFDFSHPQALSQDERAAVEAQVNQAVFENHPVRTFIVPIDEARKLGAMMLFGEKYGDEVRVVEVDGVSRELCGGTHVRSTAEIGPFVILSEARSARARGGSRRSPPARRSRCSARARDEAEELRGELERVRKEAKKPQGEADADVEVRSHDQDVLVVEVKGATGGALRDLTDRLRQQESRVRCSPARPTTAAFLVFNLDQSLADRASTRSRSSATRPSTSRAAGAGGRRSPRRGKKPEALGDALDAARGAPRAALKVLALDYGSARTGVAVSDPTGTVARPLCTSSGRDAGVVRALVERGGAERVVVGSL
jgi:alanyl-tRNA synthetase